MQTGTFSALYFSNLIDIIAAQGWPRQAQLDMLGLTDTALGNPAQRLAVEMVNDHFLHAAKVLACPHLGLIIGHQFRVATFVESGSILAFCDSLAHAAIINSRYQALTETAGKSALVREDGRAFLRWTPNFADDDGFTMVSEVIVAGYVTTIRWLAWVYQKDLKSLSFRHAAPSYADKYDEILQGAIRFGQAHTQVEFFAETVDEPLPMANPEKLAIIAQKLDRILLGVSEESNLARRVKAAIRTVLAEGPLTLPCVADELEMSERSLRRKLRREGEGFRELTETVRKAMFETLIARGESLTTIAQALGYHDQSAFIKAFHRWHGMSPSQYKSSKLGL